MTDSTTDYYSLDEDLQDIYFAEYIQIFPLELPTQKAERLRLLNWYVMYRQTYNGAMIAVRYYWRKLWSNLATELKAAFKGKQSS